MRCRKNGWDSGGMASWLHVLYIALQGKTAQRNTQQNIVQRHRLVCLFDWFSSRLILSAIILGMDLTWRVRVEKAFDYLDPRWVTGSGGRLLDYSVLF